jgi:hypothetical protein
MIGELMKKRLNIIITVLFVTLIGFGVCAEESIVKPETKSAVETPAKTETQATTQHTVLLTNLTNPINVVKSPNSYIGRKINVSARFDKFATLGLDYKPALRSSETYISFLIMRTDTDKNIPLSEMKLFIKRSNAEKLIELKEGDKVQFTGTVFSSALGDAWVDVEKLEKIK